MAARASRHGNQAIRALFNGFAGKAIINYIVKANAAPTVDSIIEFHSRAERGDRDWHLPFGAGCDVSIKPVVRFMDNLVDRIRRRWPIRVRPVMRRQLLSYLMEPFIHHGLRPRIKRRKRANNPRLALGNHQFWARNDE